MKTQKRYHTEQEILELIDQYQREQRKLGVKADEADQLADALRNTSESHRIETLRFMAAKHRKGISWRAARLITLGDRLSEMRTPVLSGIEPGDGSVSSV